jgi:hypothetical protein
MFTVVVLCGLTAFILIVLSAATKDKVPLWVGTLMLCVAFLLTQLPKG